MRLYCRCSHNKCIKSCMRIRFAVLTTQIPLMICNNRRAVDSPVFTAVGLDVKYTQEVVLCLQHSVSVSVTWLDVFMTQTLPYSQCSGIPVRLFCLGECINKN